MLNDIEDIRLKNLRRLHGSTNSSGGPTSEAVVDFLSANGVSISKAKISDIYWRKKPIDAVLASKIEKAFDVCPGWLSQDQSVWHLLAPAETQMVQQFMTLSESAKEHISAIIQLVSGSDAQQGVQADVHEKP